MGAMFSLDTPHGSVPAHIEGEAGLGILLATGAGTGQDHPGVAGLRARLSERVMVMTFEYSYRAAGRSFPDRVPKLLDVHRAAAAHLRGLVGERLVLAGRSMGGRMSSMLAAAGEPCAAVVAYGYPLHPPGKPDKLRVEHLAAITVPMLLISGTNDALARPDLVETHLAPLPTAHLRMIEGANHSFRRKGTSPEAMLDLLATNTITWLDSLTGLADSAPNPP